ncbi:MAG TPA: serine hydrolase domain-containing protein [Opitutaceae bacterium]|nr:serine hydrolase domain-containing protein [Opitutaceae bacterium]
MTLAASFAHADPIDELLKERLPELRLPGVSLAVVRDGRVLKSAAYGFADLEMKTAATPDTIFEIGSLTKQFTAAALLLLSDEGLVSLDDSVIEHFPDAPESWRAITLRHLLTHTSGIQNHVAVPEFMNELFGGRIAREELPGRFFALPLEFQPGETWSYDNTGYYLLGLVIERVAGTDFWSFLDERIFKPLEMRDTGPNDPTGSIPNMAKGYGLANNNYARRPFLPPFVALSAGAIRSTVGDLAKWEAALVEGTLLGSQTQAAMWTATRGADGGPLPVPYGFGWIVESWRGEPVVQHSGGTPGFSSTIYRFPRRGIAVILLANHGDRILDTLALDIAGLVEPALQRPIDAQDPDATRSGRLCGVLESLLKGSPRSADLTPAMNRFLGTTTGKSWFEWIASHGEPGRFEFSEFYETPDGRVSRYRVALDGKPYWFSFLCTPDGRIAQVNPW